MMKYLQKLGKSLMLPVACLPAAGILLGLGYWIDPDGWGTGSAIAAFLVQSGKAIIDNMAILFAIGVAIGMSDDNDGTAALAGIVSWLMVQTVLAPGTVAMFKGIPVEEVSPAFSIGMSDDNDGTAALAGIVSWLMVQTVLAPGTVAMFKGIPVEEVSPAFSKINNQFIGILTGIIGSMCYNKFKNTKLPDALSFFSGKRSVAIVTSVVSLVACLILFFIWPVIYAALVAFGEGIISLGAIGAGIYGFFNRLLIPVGLHHALNSVFWFDVANISDIARFWGIQDGGVLGQTGMYMSGFFPVMMFGPLSFFSGKRSVAIVTSVVSLVACLILFFIWPVIYAALIAFGEGIISLGAIGAGIYGFFNRLLIPVGLHHALNSVFWFDVANISDIARFWGIQDGGVLGQTGMYMSGFFPVMMFGLPAASLAMYHTAKSNKKKMAAGLLLAASVCSFLTGVTEPLEFAFMFLAPGLYVIHALLTGISLFVVALLPVRSGFNFSAGFIDWLLSFKAPMALNPLYLIPIGIVCGIIYYVVFRFAIVKFNFKTPGREDDDENEVKVTLSNEDFLSVATTILEGLGGKENLTSIDNCITRLRLEIVDYTKVDEKKIKSAGVAGVIRPSKTSVQVVIGTKVQFVADEMKKLVK